MKYPELKIKIKSLAEEARIIRVDERKLLGSWRWLEKNAQTGCVEKGLTRRKWSELRAHRIHDIRIEQRATLIAYGYLRGKAYRQIEQAPHWLKPPYSRPGPSWTKITAMIVKYQGGDKKVVFEQLKAWRGLPLQAKAA